MYHRLLACISARLAKTPKFGGIVLVLVLDLLAVRGETRADLSATVLFPPAWQRSGLFSRLRARFLVSGFGLKMAEAEFRSGRCYHGRRRSADAEFGACWPTSTACIAPLKNHALGESMSSACIARKSLKICERCRLERSRDNFQRLIQGRYSRVVLVVRKHH